MKSKEEVEAALREVYAHLNYGSPMYDFDEALEWVLGIVEFPDLCTFRKGKCRECGKDQGVKR